MKHLKKLQMIVALLMAINIVSVGYSAWSITFPTVDTRSGSFDSYPVIKTDQYLILQQPTIPFTEFCNYIPDGETEETGGFMMTDDINADGYLDVIQAVTIPFKLVVQNGYVQDTDIFTNECMQLEITVSFGKDSTESTAFFDSLTASVSPGDDIPFGGTMSGLSVKPQNNGTLLISAQLYIPKEYAKGGSVSFYLDLNTTNAFEENLFPATGEVATAKNLIFSTVIKTITTSTQS